jgi:hypothetical protein
LLRKTVQAHLSQHPEPAMVRAVATVHATRIRPALALSKLRAPAPLPGPVDLNRQARRPRKSRSLIRDWVCPGSVSADQSPAPCPWKPLQATAGFARRDNDRCPTCNALAAEYTGSRFEEGGRAAALDRQSDLAMEILKLMSRYPTRSGWPVHAVTGQAVPISHAILHAESHKLGLSVVEFRCGRASPEQNWFCTPEHTLRTRNSSSILMLFDNDPPTLEAGTVEQLFMVAYRGVWHRTVCVRFLKPAAGGPGPWHGKFLTVVDNSRAVQRMHFVDEVYSQCMLVPWPPKPHGWREDRALAVPWIERPVDHHVVLPVQLTAAIAMLQPQDVGDCISPYADSDEASSN